MKPLLLRWTRRTFVIVLYGVVLAALVAGFVPLAFLAATSDVVRGQPWTMTRTLVFFVWYFGCELVGVAASFAIWAASLVEGDRDRFLERNFALQHWWARTLGRGGFRILDLRIEADEHGYRFGRTPVLVLVRHASTADTVLAALLLSVPHGTRLRYVLKRELLWDPCLDIVGNRLPNVFVKRDSAETAREAAAVGDLARGLGPNDGVLIYPEGTRFSPAKRARIAAKLREQGREDAARDAEALHHVLRPRSGGVLALLESAPQADVVFLAHAGFEGSASFDRFFNGGLIGKTVHAELRVVKSADIPTTIDARRAWLLDQWRQVDAFVERHQDIR